MFANKVLISLALVAAMPSALSRYVRTWENRLFPDDLVRNFPPANIEDLHISREDVIPDVEIQPDSEEDDNKGQNRDIFGRKVVPNYDDTVNKVSSMDVHPEIEEVVVLDNDVNNQNNYPNQDESIVPEKKWNVRQREPIVIMVDPSDEQSQDYPSTNEDSENKNEEIETWDNDEDSNEIPQPAARSQKSWIPW